MKKFIAIAFTVLLAASVSNAQENNIKRIPSVGGNTSVTDYSSADRGFWMAAELSGGASLRINHRNAPFGELDVTAGYRFCQYLKVGLGFGARYFINNDCLRRSSVPWDFPLYASVRGNFIDETYRTCVPYYSLDAGAAIRDGFMIRPTVGLRFGQPRSAFLLGLSYVGQVVSGYDESVPGLVTDKNRFVSMLALRLGYEF